MTREEYDGISVALDPQTISFGFCVSTEWEVVFLGGTTLAEVILVKGQELPTIVKILPVGWASTLFFMFLLGVCEILSFDEVDVITNPTLRIHNAHPQSQILGDPNTPVQTRSSLKKITEAHALVSYIQAHQRSNHKDQQHCLFACFLSQFEPRKVTEALEDMEAGEAMAEELMQVQASTSIVWCYKPNGANGEDRS
ncbi:hypothetical protein Tco_1533043 [Tanacetum coccineum]